MKVGLEHKGNDLLSDFPKQVLREIYNRNRKGSADPHEQQNDGNKNNNIIDADTDVFFAD